MKSNFNKYPFIKLRPTAEDCDLGWDKIASELSKGSKADNYPVNIIVVDCYQGVNEDEILLALQSHLKPRLTFLTSDVMLTEKEIANLTQNDVTEDRVFGFMTRLNMEQFFDQNKLVQYRDMIATINSGTILVFGIGASLLVNVPHTLVYADMARWEIQLRMRRNEVSNLGISNSKDSIEAKYKRAYFVDWRVCDKHKKKIMDKWDFVLDTNKSSSPKMLSGKIVREGLNLAVKQPFSPVPYFDAGPWGGQWMKKVCGLDEDAENYAWCFNCVPEENSVLFGLGDVKFELPSINIVFYQPSKLLGEAVHGRFGDEFPIRFDFLDTMGGGNLSLQVHPLTEYIQEKFGLNYTQDESYYLLDTEDDANVYLGLKEDVDGDKMISDLKKSEIAGSNFDVEKYVEKWPAKKHDHFLIPAGTVHCSGKNSMVLEISSTPYIFTFKLYDWGRLGMNGKPRPINISHGTKVIDWERTTQWTKDNLVNQFETLSEKEGLKIEKTGLHEREFIETRRYWFDNSVNIESRGSVQVFNVIEGREVVVQSINDTFEPMIFHYAETFILPANAGEIRIKTHGESLGQKCAVIEAYVRF